MDSEGFIWLGSDNTVYRYDGVHVIPYSLVQDNSDKVILVTDMVETPDGRIMVATDNGLFSMEKSDCGHIHPKPFFQDKITGIKSLALHPDGYLLIATPSALWSYSILRGTLQRILIDRDPLSQTNIPAAMAVTPEGVEVVAGDGGIYRLEKNFRVACIRKPVSDFPSPSKAVRTSDALYLATDTNGLWKIDNNGVPTHLTGVEANVVTSLSVSNDSTLFAGTDGSGIFEIDSPTGKVRRRLTHRPGALNSLQSNQIYSLMTDRDNRLWVGHYQHGLDHTVTIFPGISLLTINNEDKAVRTITILPDRNILAGTRAGIYFLSPNGDKVLKNISRPLLRSNMVISTAIVGDTIFVGTYGGGLSLLSASSGTLLPGKSPLPEDMEAAHIFSIYPRQDNKEIWIGTSKGLFRALNGKTTRYTSENSALPEGNVYTVFFDSSGKGWIGTENGIAIWDPALKKLRTDCFPENFISKAKVRQIYEGKNRTLYFVLENGKIAISNIDMSEFSRPEIFDKRNYIIKAVAEDRFGFVWLATNHGLLRWDKLSHISVFERDNGIPATPFIHCVPAREKSMIRFGNACGMVNIDTDILSKFVSQSILTPSVISAEGNACIDHFITAPDSNEILVPFKKYSKKVTLKITPLCYEEPDNSKYEYRINNGAWLSMPAGYIITLHNVDYGDTKIFLRPIDDENFMTTIVLQMPARISRWIWISAIAVIILAAGAWIMVRLHKFKRIQNHPHEEKNGYATPAVPQTDASVKTPEPVIINDVPDTSASPEKLSDKPDKSGSKSTGLTEKADDSSSERSKYSGIWMQPKECEALVKKINSILEKDKPYTNPDLKITDLARLADISSNRLSYVLSQHLNINFYDFINQYRIAEFKRLVESGADQTLTLTAMSERAGFSSRSSFFRCFKKLEGITPGEYLKRKS